MQLVEVSKPVNPKRAIDKPREARRESKATIHSSRSIIFGILCLQAFPQIIKVVPSRLNHLPDDFPPGL